MTTWITDEKGNRASVEYFGSEEAARAALSTLRNCRNCDNCMDCTRCRSCTRCAGCRDCTGCAGCRDCTGCTRSTYCTRCDLTNPHYRLPVSDHRGYTWLAIWNGKEWRVYAGCRVAWSIDQARVHWLSPNYDGPQSVRETVGFALDWIEAKKP